MKTSEGQLVKLAPEVLWPWLADPSRWPQWNAKMKAVNRSASGLVKRGETFSFVTNFSRSQPTHAEVVRLEPNQRLVLRCRYEWKRHWCGVTEDWKLVAQQNGTLVRHVTNFRDSGISPVVQWLIWFFQRFGRPVGPSMWRKLEDAAKAEACQDRLA